MKSEVSGNLDLQTGGYWYSKPQLLCIVQQTNKAEEDMAYACNATYESGQKSVEITWEEELLLPIRVAAQPGCFRPKDNEHSTPLFFISLQGCAT